ncbi:translation initiation factor 4E [Nematocida homosporus]|uniref:translation initiation factor 4E n=1 Tax=Nematocida homosporus TaxID=1912981 RepID=UPI00221F18C3|nr:translation initiation factor 4E [Nematocida homosporus]KAI5184619.1 translation initiation factor 4E [Nematocida homosporus]
MSMGIEPVSQRHQLNESWTLWYDFQEKKYVNTDNWSDNLQQLGIADNAEMFWAIIDKIGETQDLPISSNLHFFRKDILPMWEDQRNLEGGKWVLELPSPQLAHQVWTDTLLFCISELCMLRTVQMEGSELVINESTIDEKLAGVICGAVLSPRKNCVRISIWTSIKDNRVLQVGKLWRENGKIPDSFKILFKAHENAIRGSRDISSDVYTL